MAIRFQNRREIVSPFKPISDRCMKSVPIPSHYWRGDHIGCFLLLLNAKIPSLLGEESPGSSEARRDEKGDIPVGPAAAGFRNEFPWWDGLGFDRVSMTTRHTK